MSGSSRESNTPTVDTTERTLGPPLSGGFDALADMYEDGRQQHFYRQALAIVGCPQEAEDVVGEAFAITAGRLNRGAEIENMGGYLHAVVRNVAIQSIRQRKSAVPLHEEMEQQHTQSTPELAQTRENCQALYRAIDQLPSAQRAAFVLAEVRGFNYRETAANLNRSEAAIRQLLSRARSRIRDALGPDVAPGTLPLLHLYPERFTHLRTHKLGLREQIATKLANAQGSLASLTVHSAEFVSRVAQPAAALVAAALVVGSVSPASPENTAPPANQTAADSPAAAAPQALPTPASKRGSTANQETAPGQSGDRATVAPVGAGGGSGSGNDKSHGSQATNRGSQSTHLVGSQGESSSPHAPSITGSADDGTPQGGVISQGTDGSAADGPSGRPSVNSGGGWVAFVSWAGNLVSGDTNGASDIFLSSAADRSTALISVGLGDRQPANGPSDSPAISSQGPFVAFSSAATNLVEGDSNGARDVFVRNYDTHATELSSLSTSGRQGNGDSDEAALSASGRYVAFTSSATNLVTDTNGFADVFVRDRQAGTTQRISVGPSEAQANGASGEPSVSADGRYVVFTSSATNLVPGDTNGVSDVFVYDRTPGAAPATQLISKAPGSARANGASSQPAISADGGRYVAFTSAASNLTPADSDNNLDVFEYDRYQGTTARVSKNLGGGQGGTGTGEALPPTIAIDCTKPSIDASGRRVAFQCVAATDPTSADQSLKGADFVHYLATDDSRLAISLSLAQRAHATTLAPTISGDGGVLAGVVSVEVAPTTGNGQPFSDRAVFELSLDH